jgi:hypothetical protein
VKCCNAYIVLFFGAGLFTFPLQSVEQSSTPDEEFLVFLADMHTVDGELTDPLDMIDIQDEGVLDASNSTHEQLVQPKPSLKDINSELETTINSETKALARSHTVEVKKIESKNPATDKSSTEDK